VLWDHEEQCTTLARPEPGAAEDFDAGGLDVDLDGQRITVGGLDGELYEGFFEDP
jgi:hypothetical protein